MRKALAALMLMVATFSVPVLSTPAEARVAPAVDCTAGSRTHEWNVENFEGSVEYRFFAKLQYTNCPSFNEFQYVQYRVDRIRGNCRNWGPSHVQDFELNWGAYGAWNPPIRTFECPLADDSVTKTVYSNAVQWHSAADDCAKVYLLIRKDNAPDIEKESANKCLTQ